MSAAGTWDIRIKTPIGDQTARLSVVPDHVGGFTGTVSGDPGSLDIAGKVDGDRLTWTMKTTKPMPLDLDCNALVQGDTLEGGVKAGMFGTMALTGTRVG
ncbi:hypothetical protein HNO88_003605 [Novosphingobium chloroacetimidivorans]|uniref:Uncharacterized protein n=1 Tax=Novosphingobium chloroacetimidivorans TaxID=1428314 RepID=A0A7W7KDJ4_9SPHN|nr:hypothetical protein [Novosphingobium chloroacetimidivorans]MBB4860263.1 hypothetical protein [Novosphingobium chloroacetimidivorans]